MVLISVALGITASVRHFCDLLHVGLDLAAFVDISLSEAEEIVSALLVRHLIDVFHQYLLAIGSFC
jgi:hypothetical protein